MTIVRLYEESFLASFISWALPCVVIFLSGSGTRHGGCTQSQKDNYYTTNASHTVQAGSPEVDNVL